jgi:hypothetical protein
VGRWWLVLFKEAGEASLFPRACMPSVVVGVGVVVVVNPKSTQSLPHVHTTIPPSHTLPPPKKQVLAREKEATRRWARMALTGFCALLVPLFLMLLTAGVKIEEVEVEQPSVAGEAEGEGGPNGTPRTTTTTTTVRRRRLSIGGGRLSIGGGGGVSFGGGGTPLAGGKRRTSLAQSIFSPMK